ncbi:cytochrome P450 [Serendipita vermifera]|nr:cytochrome P450 [Serendipita vermifera]
MNVLGKKMIVINGLDVARVLLEKRGGAYSNRAGKNITFLGMGWDWNFIVAQPGPFHSECRAIFKRAIGLNGVTKYDPLIQEEANKLVDGLNDVRGDPWSVVHKNVGAIIIRVAYGDSIYKAHGEELIHLNHEALNLITWAAVRFWLIDYFKSLHNLPDWIPLPFKKVGNKGREMLRKMQMWPWNETLRHHKEGIAEPSIALEYIENPETVSSPNVTRDALGIMYAAGTDNTACTFATFLSMMLLHPLAQRQIQAELDRFGAHNITLDDRESLPYFNAAWNESMRLNPSSPLGVPHLSTTDDIYSGMYLPKSTLYLANIGYMGRDPRIWDEPNVFKPERWLKDYNPNAGSLPDISDIVFGFGRRICPGRFLADRIGFAFAATVLKAYSILPLEGEVLPHHFEYKDASTRRPLGVRCRFVRRSRF